MFRKKNVVIGVSGVMVCVLLIILGPSAGISLFSHLYVTGGLIALGLFFIGLMIGGVFTGFCIGGGVVFILVATLFPERYRGLFVLAVLAALVINSNWKDLKQLLKKGGRKSSASQETLAFDEDEEELPLDEPLDLQEIYLIKPNITKPDIVYKVFAKEGRLFFCKVGGQFYDISEKIDFHAEMPEEDLLRPKHNFAIGLADIVDVFMDPKPSCHTGAFPNNGAVHIAAGGKPVRYLIHPVLSFQIVAAFFRGQCHIEPKVKDRSNPREEAFQQQIRRLRREATYDTRKVVRVVKVVNAMAMIAMLWAILYPEPYEAAIIVNILFIAYAVFVSVRFKAAVDVYSDKKGLPQLWVLLWPMGGLVIRSMADCNVLYTPGAWVGMGVLAMLMALFIYLNTREYLKRQWTAIFLPLLCFGAVYGAVITTDYTFDPSTPRQHNTIIASKRIDDGKTTSYYLSLEPWGDVEDRRDVEVSKSLYDRTAIGQSIYVYEMNGLWGIHWYYPSDKNK